MRISRKRAGLAGGIGIVLAAVLAIVFLIGPATGPSVAAQAMATPSPAARPAKANLYQDFVTKLSTNLGINDPAKVDAAIKTSLNQMVDQAAAAGRLKPKAVTALKQRINRGAFAKAFTAFLKDLEKKGAHKKHQASPKVPAVATPAV